MIEGFYKRSNEKENSNSRDDGTDILHKVQEINKNRVGVQKFVKKYVLRFATFA